MDGWSTPSVCVCVCVCVCSFYAHLLLPALGRWEKKWGGGVISFGLIE